MTEDYTLSFKSILQSSKFSIKHLDELSDIIFRVPKDKRLVFDLSSIDWIGHEEFVYLCAIFNHFYKVQRPFFIKILNEEQKNYRQALLIMSMWEVWKIYSFVEKNEEGFYDYDKYLDIDGTYIQYLKKNILKTSETELEISYSHKITPFTSLTIDPNLNTEEQVKEDIKNIYTLDFKTKELLKIYHTDTPFLNRTLSSIITKELYENSIDHAFGNKNYSLKECYFGVTLKNKFEETNLNRDYLNKKNFHEEQLPESISFFKDNLGYKNQSYIQFTFLDFGDTIPDTLKGIYLEKVIKNVDFINMSFSSDHLNQHLDTRILEYAFNYSSSRYQISERFQNRESIPRGLFDVIGIVKRYKGLIIVRSGFGKILFDFSSADINVKQATRYFGNREHYFSGTIISIIIPESTTDIEKKAIKPQIVLGTINRASEYVSIAEIQKRINTELNFTFNKDEKKKELYNKTFDYLDEVLDSFAFKKCTLYIDFAGSFFEEKPIKKILYYLATTYKINENVNAIIINPPDEVLIKSIQDNINDNTQETDSFIYHPIPCIYYDYLTQQHLVTWLGKINKEQEEALTYALKLEDFNKSKGDFNNNIVGIEGNIFSFDGYGNLIRHIPHVTNLAVNSIILKNVINNPNEVYLTAGNYFQYEYISFLESLQEERNQIFLSTHLLSIIPKKIIEQCDALLSITLSSQLLAKGLLNQINEKYGKNIKLIRLSNYHSYFREKPFLTIKEKAKVILCCDVVSTGYIVKHLREVLEKRGISLLAVAALVDSRQYSQGANELPSYDNDKLLPTLMYSLLSRPVTKYIKNVNNYKHIIRINPITNSINSLSYEKSESRKILISDTKEFLNDLSNLKGEYLRIGLFEQNEVNHSYWVEVRKLFNSQNGVTILSKMINSLKKLESHSLSNVDEEKRSLALEMIKNNLRYLQETDSNLKKNLNSYTLIKKSIFQIEKSYAQQNIPFDKSEYDYVFYPIYSGVELITDHQYKYEIFKDPRIIIVPLARFNTEKGWRFSFPPKYLNKLTRGKSVFLIDAGSITGDTIIQMIDQICYLDVKKITALSVIGRVEDFQREFFSRLKEMKVKNYNVSEEVINYNSMSGDHIIPVNVYFGSHLHIPVYKQNTMNPFWLEKEKISEYLGINNVPSFVKSYLAKRIKELQPISIDMINDEHWPDYLPKDKGSKKIPVSDIFYFRDQIGRISGYRFFNEYFKFFDDILSYYEDSSLQRDKDRYKKLELIVAVLLHESHLIESIKNLLPDLYNKLKVFIELIIIKKRLAESRLSYSWERYALLKFLLLIWKDELFYNNLKIDELIKVFHYCEQDASGKSFEYLSFTIFSELNHFSKDNINGSRNVQIENRIAQLKQQKNKRKLSNTSLRILDRIEQYCLTNPYQSFSSTIQDYSNELRKLYNDEEVKGRTHSTIEADLNLIKVQILSLKCNGAEIDKQIIEIAITEIKNVWPNVKETLSLIIKNAKPLDSILRQFNHGILSKHLYLGSESLENRIIQFDDALYDNTFYSNINEMNNIIQFIVKHIVPNNSACNTFFKSYKVYVYDYIDSKLRKDLINNGYEYEEIKEGHFNNLMIDIHEQVLNYIIYRELKNNILNHAKQNSKVTVVWKQKKEKLELSINSLNKYYNNRIEKYNKESHKNSGLELIKDMGKYYNYDIIHSDYTKNEREFKTTIIFNI